MINRFFPIIFGLQGAILGAYFAIWQPKILARGFGINDLALLMAFETLFATFIDLPTGSWADRFGNKKITMIGVILYVLAFIFPSFSTSPLALAMGVISIGVGDAFINGALDAWTTDALTNGTSGSYFSREHWAGRGRIIGALFVPLVFTLLGEPVLGIWWIFLSLSILLTIVSYLAPTGRKPQIFSSSNVVQDLSTTLASLWAERNARIILLVCFFFGISDGIIAVGLRPKLVQFGIQASVWFGVFQASLTAFRLLGLRYYRLNGFDLKPMDATRIGLLISGICIVLFGFTTNLFLAIALWWLRVAFLSAYFPGVKDAISRTKTGKMRTATALSASGLATTAGMVLSASACGVFESLEHHLTLAFTISGVVASSCYFFISKKPRQAG